MGISRVYGKIIGNRQLARRTIKGTFCIQIYTNYQRGWGQSRTLAHGHHGQ